MRYLTSKTLLTTFAFASLGQSASAVDGTFDNLSVGSGLCIGVECNDVTSMPETARFAHDKMVLKYDDTSKDGSPKRDWALKINDGPVGGLEKYAIEDSTEGTTPFSIQGGVNTDALVVAPDGVGMGTMLPQEDLHIVSPDQSSIGLEIAGQKKGEGKHYVLMASGSGFIIMDKGGSAKVPFKMKSDAPTDAMVVDGSGNIGLGTSDPKAQFEMATEKRYNYFRITAKGAKVHTSADITFTGGPLGTGQLRYNILDGDDHEMSLDANGNLVLMGTLTSAGPTCAAGCDRVFDEDYPLPSISEHASLMFDAGHLPSIGVTVPHAPVNLSERQGNIINSLEHAHIYINDLHERTLADGRRLAAQQEELDRLRAENQQQRMQMQAELQALHARLDTIETD